MWNLISCNKLAEQRTLKKNYDIHKEKLRKMRPMMKMREPQQPDFVYSKHKLEMARRDRLIEIDRQNEILLNKMQTIRDNKYTENQLRPEAQNLKTLNQYVMNTIAEQIYNQNKRICNKLLRVGSYYPTTSIMQKTEELEKVRLNISHNARRAKSARTLIIRPQSSYTTGSSKFYRSRSRADYNGQKSEQKLLTMHRYSSKGELRPQSAPCFNKKVKGNYQSVERLREGTQNIQQFDRGFQ